MFFFLMSLIIFSIHVLVLLVYVFGHRFWMHFGIMSRTIFEFFGVRISDDFGLDIFNPLIDLKSKMDPEMHPNR